MIINYSGINLKVVQTLSFDRQPVLDDSGVDYLFTKFQISVIAVVNSQSSSVTGVTGTEGVAYVPNTSTFGGDPSTLIIPGVVPPGISQFSGRGPTTPILTDVLIRHWLARPRAPLFIFAEDGQVILQSPNVAGAVCDAHNGPFCNVLSIQQVLGQNQTFIVNCQFTTYVNECQQAENTMAALLSNRWSQYHTLDDDYNLIIVTNGVSRFRTDLVYNVMNPDILRGLLFLPIPVGFKRHVDYVEGVADVSAIRWQTTDVQTPQQFVVGNEVNATRAELIYRETLYSGDDPTGVVLSSIDRVANFRWLAKSNAEAEKPLSLPHAPASRPIAESPRAGGLGAHGKRAVEAGGKGGGS